MKKKTPKPAQICIDPGVAAEFKRHCRRHGLKIGATATSILQAWLRAGHVYPEDQAPEVGHA